MLSASWTWSPTAGSNARTTTRSRGLMVRASSAHSRLATCWNSPLAVLAGER
jgi:hypothetical protein